MQHRFTDGNYSQPSAAATTQSVASLFPSPLISLALYHSLLLLRHLTLSIFWALLVRLCQSAALLLLHLIPDIHCAHLFVNSGWPDQIATRCFQFVCNLCSMQRCTIEWNEMFCMHCNVILMNFNVIWFDVESSPILELNKPV